MNFYLTESFAALTSYEKLDTSASAASKTRTTLKKLGHGHVETTEIDIIPTRTGILEFYNKRHAVKEE